uniref:Uncharacterized protein n=1 Tax=Palpitomonas bilix TaxID=652834 RepID=A0A7S3GH82_9EUKA|mmetsp:Transcript_4945/g.10545  ORF Transcript_4945/g.10545 Transcript_4945/m.10545 type:complete len:662 (+) Transcript_4945:746-2731(+)
MFVFLFLYKGVLQVRYSGCSQDSRTPVSGADRLQRGFSVHLIACSEAPPSLREAPETAKQGDSHTRSLCSRFLSLSPRFRPRKFLSPPLETKLFRKPNRDLYHFGFHTPFAGIPMHQYLLSRVPRAQPSSQQPANNRGENDLFSLRSRQLLASLWKTVKKLRCVHRDLSLSNVMVLEATLAPGRNAPMPSVQVCFIDFAEALDTGVEERALLRLRQSLLSCSGPWNEEGFLVGTVYITPPELLLLHDLPNFSHLLRMKRLSNGDVVFLHSFHPGGIGRPQPLLSSSSSSSSYSVAEAVAMEDLRRRRRQCAQEDLHHQTSVDAYAIALQVLYVAFGMFCNLLDPNNRRTGDEWNEDLWVLYEDHRRSLYQSPAPLMRQAPVREQRKELMRTLRFHVSGLLFQVLLLFEQEDMARFSRIREEHRKEKHESDKKRGLEHTFREQVFLKLQQQQPRRRSFSSSVIPERTKRISLEDRERRDIASVTEPCIWRESHLRHLSFVLMRWFLFHALPEKDDMDASLSASKRREHLFPLWRFPDEHAPHSGYWVCAVSADLFEEKGTWWEVATTAFRRGEVPSVHIRRSMDACMKQKWNAQRREEEGAGTEEQEWTSQHKSKRKRECEQDPNRGHEEIQTYVSWAWSVFSSNWEKRQKVWESVRTFIHE